MIGQNDIIILKSFYYNYFPYLLCGYLSIKYEHSFILLNDKEESYMKKILASLLLLGLSLQAYSDPAEILTQITKATTEAKQADTTYYNISTTPLFLDKANLSEKGEGRVITMAPVKVLAVDDDINLMEVEITGWQPDNVGHVIYAAKGKRIIKALIGKPNADKIEKLGSEIDEDTEQNWNQVSLKAWVKPDNFIADAALLNNYGDELNHANCSSCHAIRTADHYLANRWPGILKSMKRFVSMDDEQYDSLQMYLQYNAKDMQAGETTH